MLTVMLILNVVLDVAIVAGLALVMSRAAKLAPHSPTAAAALPSDRRAVRRARALVERVPAPHPVLIDRLDGLNQRPPEPSVASRRTRHCTSAVSASESEAVVWARSA
jgi:hypothetical protein